MHRLGSERPLSDAVTECSSRPTSGLVWPPSHACSHLPKATVLQVSSGNPCPSEATSQRPRGRACGEDGGEERQKPPPPPQRRDRPHRRVDRFQTSYYLSKHSSLGCLPGFRTLSITPLRGSQTEAGPGSASSGRPPREPPRARPPLARGADLLSPVLLRTSAPCLPSHLLKFKAPPSSGPTRVTSQPSARLPLLPTEAPTALAPRLHLDAVSSTFSSFLCLASPPGSPTHFCAPPHPVTCITGAVLSEARIWRGQRSPSSPLGRNTSICAHNENQQTLNSLLKSVKGIRET